MEEKGNVPFPAFYERSFSSLLCRFLATWLKEEHPP
jgi:hypothetical protein